MGSRENQITENKTSHPKSVPIFSPALLPNISDPDSCLTSPQANTQPLGPRPVFLHHLLN